MTESDDPQNESPVFIVGAPRSGTSLLYRMLQGHSRLKPQNSASETGVELTEAHVFNDPYGVERTTSLDFMLGNEEVYRNFLDCVAPIRARHERIRGKSRLAKLFSNYPSLRQLWWRFLRNDRLVRAFFHYAKEARGVARILEKTPSEILVLPEMRSTFPKAKFLFVHRHPIDVYSSYKRRQKVANSLNPVKKEKWLEISPEKFCDLYRRYAEIAMKESAEDSRNFRIISYEDLVNAPEAALKSVFEFIGESFEPTCVPQTDTNRTVWKADPHLFGKVKKTTKNWREFVSDEQAGVIERELGPQMEKLDYKPYTDAS